MAGEHGAAERRLALLGPGVGVRFGGDEVAGGGQVPGLGRPVKGRAAGPISGGRVRARR